MQPYRGALDIEFVQLLCIVVYEFQAKLAHVGPEPVSKCGAITLRIPDADKTLQRRIHGIQSFGTNPAK